MIFQLSESEIAFPPVELAESDGLLAVGGNLSVERLLLAYKSGIFPWYSYPDPILWYAPTERCVLFPSKINISKSMQQIMRRNRFDLSINTAFEQVMQHCANIKRNNQDGTWINADMIKAYVNLHLKGHAHSIEVWQNQVLVGGLYGVDLGTVFCGESMFSLQPNASKLALIQLCTQMHYSIIDCQIPNDHLMRMGAEMISMETYKKYL